jgi:hypothetical protein
MTPDSDRLYELLERTARMDEKLDILVNSVEKQETRLDHVEKHVNMGYGVVACITFVVSAFAQFIWEKIIGKSS